MTTITRSTEEIIIHTVDGATDVTQTIKAKNIYFEVYQSMTDAEIIAKFETP